MRAFFVGMVRGHSTSLSPLPSRGIRVKIWEEEARDLSWRCRDTAYILFLLAQGEELQYWCICENGEVLWVRLHDYRPTATPASQLKNLSRMERDEVRALLVAMIHSYGNFFVPTYKPRHSY